MGWEKRRNGFYYYYKVREGGRVRSHYLGKKAFAQLGVRIVQDKKLGRRIDREALHSAQQADAEIDQQLATVEAVISTLTNAKLYADGYHKHKGQWRKKRHESNATTSTSATT